MKKRINWLHFTDLHYGQANQDILLPKIKRELFADLEFIKNDLGKIDVVFFTGDLTQSGSKEEFDALTVFLNELWEHFRKLGSSPVLIAIPGNHDLQRPNDPTRAIVKVLKNYQNDEELKENFWKGISSKNENYKFIYECFKNYHEWYKNINIPKPSDLKYGLIPGDISANILINDLSLKIVGLNTAFLELSNDDYLRKLALNPAQIINLTSSDPLEWLEDADISILMTHHDPTWYDSQSSGYYNNDINPPNTFYSHLCGHLHTANTFEHGLIGSPLRKIQLAPSLFGLLKIKSGLDRIHGYYAGSYIVMDDVIHERFYPRKAQKDYDGNYKIVPDYGFNLDNKNFLDVIKTRKTDNQINNEEQTVLDETIPVTENIQKNILDLSTSSDKNIELDAIPIVSYPLLSQHASIRLIEQQNFIRLINSNHYAWLITDWGLDEDGFIGSISEKLQLDRVRSGFLLNCEDIVTETELFFAFEQQFGMTLQTFCNNAAEVKNMLLIFNHVNANLYSNNKSYYKFLEIIKSINDFCQSICVVIICSQAPNFLTPENYVKLLPLDESEIRFYVDNNATRIQELENFRNLFKLVEITSGLPKHIDRIINRLKVASFEELLESEQDINNDYVDVDQIPKSLKQSIGILANSTDRKTTKSFKLLKILTILSNGETIGNLKKFDGTDPIYIDNANELEQLSLIDVVSTTRALSKIKSNISQQIRILRVPRQIRDYINTIITDLERETIIYSACDLYFGDKWRRGVIKNIYSNLSVFGEAKFLNLDNCHIITNNLMSNAIKNNKNHEIERAANLAINFCKQLYNHSDYKNAVNTSEEIYHWLKGTSFGRLKAINAKMLGESLRMIDSDTRANQILNEALEIKEGHLSNDEKNSIYIDLGYMYIDEGKLEKAIEVAKAIEKTSTPKDAHSLQAKYILIQATFENDILVKRLKSLESEARKANENKVANSISLKITDLETDLSERSKRLSKIQSSKDDDYNKMRAVVKKTLDSVTKGDGIISEEDLISLSLSYSYLYNQRLEGLFKSCHKALWIYCTKEKRTNDLLNLFKHSSFIWRISGEIQLEKKYFTELDEIIKDNANMNVESVDAINLIYYNRRKLEFERQLSMQ